ncbi:MAG: AEC family transporter [Ruminococcaceae bacterium]|nr:AEC family transporter [Oscillospiraceae bacterium]
MNFTTLLTTIATLAMLLLTGYIGGKTKIIDEVSTEKLSALILKVGQPFLIIGSFFGLDYSRENLKTGFLILLLGLCMNAGMAALAYLFAKPVRDMDERKLSEFTMVFSNCGFIGFPILYSLMGDIGLFYGAFYLVSYNLFVWTWGVVILARKRDDIKITPKKILLNFGTLPCVIGILLFSLNVPVPEFLKDLSSYLGGLCTPVSMLIAGANIARRSIKKMLTSGKVYWVCAVKLIIMPIAVTFVTKVLGLPDYMIIFGCVMAAMPGPTAVTMFGELYHISPGYAAELVGSSTILSIATIPPVVMFAEWIASM